MNVAAYYEPNVLVVLLIILILITQSHVAAHAQLLGVQAQLRYDMFESKKAGESPIGDGHLSTNYNLSVRRSVFPFSSLVTDVTLGTSSSADQYGSLDNRNIGMNVYYRQPSYTLMGRVNRSDYRNVSSGQSGASVGNSSNYNVGVLLSQPAYPVLNVQYSRNTSGSPSGAAASGYAANTWMLGAYYDLLPLRFTYDQSKQTSVYGGSPSDTRISRRSSVLLNQTLFQGLTLAGELSNYAMDNERVGTTSSLNTKRQVVRLQATPTSAVAASLEYSDQSSRQDAVGRDMHSGEKALSFNVRAQVLPGLNADYADQRQRISIDDGLSGIVFANTTNRNLGMSARLSDRSIISGSVSRSDYVGAGSFGSSQNSLNVSVQSRLSPSANLSLDYGRNKSMIGSDGSYGGSFGGVSLRTRTSGGVSMGASYRRSRIYSSTANANPTLQTTDSVDFDALWMPNYRLSLNLRLPYQANNGSSISETLSPAVGVRWQVDPSTNISLNYNYQSDTQWDWIKWETVGQRRRSSVLRLTHGFRDGSSLEFYYDFRGGNTGLIEWQRRMSLYYITRL